MLTYGTGTNMWVSSAPNIIIWAPTTSGWSVIRPVWCGFMTGKEAMPIGALTPSATNISAAMPKDMTTHGMKTKATTMAIE